jgi:hypothetical protein
MEPDGIEMSNTTKRGPDAEMGSDGLLREVDAVVPEPLLMAWVGPRLQTQNRCFVLAMAVLVITAAVYVIGGIYSSNEDTLLEKYDAEGGILGNDFDSAKAQDAFENAQEHKNGQASNSWWHGGGEENPFGNENAVEHGQNVAAIRKWNRTHPGMPYPGGNGKGILGHKGHNGAIGNKNNHGGHATGNNHQNGGANKRCENLSQYRDWLQATVTKEDGAKFEVLEQMNHDHQAFTYVKIMICCVVPLW